MVRIYYSAYQLSLLSPRDDDVFRVDNHKLPVSVTIVIAQSVDLNLEDVTTLFSLLCIVSRRH